MAVPAASILGRLAGSMSSCSNVSFARHARPLLCLMSESGLAGASGLVVGSLPSTSWPLGPLRSLTSAASPAPDAPLSDTREAWQPGRGSFAESAAESHCSSAARQAGAETSGPGGSDPPGAKDSAAATTSTEMDEVFGILQEMGLQPGRHCVVGDGLAEVEVGLYLNGVKVALDMEATRPSQMAASLPDAKSYAMKRAARSVLQAHGWHPVTLVASDWQQLDREQRASYLAHCINHALGMGHGGHGHGHGHGHQHGGCSGGGCSDPSHKH
ncbi:hypothetical protein PLESTB_000065700 [Pleodorina starrii]|uniref:RAP domain-containing protein n=1 Tax=Pleodorina starrii TaxID=330485 RepID=A0A9W6B9L7_9CHLO|nr:hypothetical protein PLESTM_001607700 [Pleodorina starrii]GLC48159.1 hypothetical protein PLESTB_000065700 [Pleodorina starrii]GLC67407.1 hypothetical protein PLESTF_000552800 [Pleodorina starrii]